MANLEGAPPLLSKLGLPALCNSGALHAQVDRMNAGTQIRDYFIKSSVK